MTFEDSNIVKRIFLKRYSLSRLIWCLGILLTVLLVLACRYWFLGDDCYISFRYAKHFSNGFGLVFNIGERVEGYTNFLWVLIMAGGLKLGINPEWLSNILGVVSGLILVVLVFRLGLHMYGRGLIVLLAPVCLCLSRTYACWMTGGLETRFFTLLVFAANMLLLYELGLIGKRPAFNSGWLSGLLFSMAALTRPEGYLFMALGLGLVAVIKGFKPARQDFARLAIFLFCTVLHVAWRYTYYGDFLPNTFYAKVSGIWLSQGAAYLGGFLSCYYVWFLIPWTVCGFLFLNKRAGPIQPGEKNHVCGAYFFAVFVIYTVYILIIGGDRFEHRLLDPILPVLYISIQGGLISVYEWSGRRALTRFKRDMLIYGLTLTSLAAPILTAGPLFTGFYPHEGINSVEVIAAYGRDRVEEGKILAEFIHPDEKIATVGSGALAYYNPDIYVMDIHGLSDREIARQPLEERGVVAHEKKASLEYICSKEITFINIEGRIVTPESPLKPRWEVLARKGYFCVKLKPGAFLLCGSTLPLAEIEERFAGYEILFLPAVSLCDQVEE